MDLVLKVYYEVKTMVIILKNNVALVKGDYWGNFTKTIINLF